MKKETVLLAFIFLTLSFSLMISAQENSSIFNNSSAVLQTNAGITPDSKFYFIENSLLSLFRSDIDNKDKKVAEIVAMIQEGKFDEAKIALDKYNQYASKVEKDISPDQKQRVEESAAAIYNALKSVEDQIPESQRKEFFTDVVQKEGSIVTSAEIAKKIKDLCETLSNLDPLEYSKVCKTDKNSPPWMRELDNNLTEQQRNEAKVFGDIMSECFKTAGQKCRCDEIPFRDFAETCKTAAPLATACEIEKNETACEQMDKLEMPELPEHLQSVFDRIQGNLNEAQFDLHMPKECRDANAKTPGDCAKIMIQTHAPEECRDELLAKNVQNEREARQICDEIMFKINAPQECVEKGLKDPKECGKLMFQLNAPQECIDAGITGENRNDPKECEKLMREKRPDNNGNRGPGFNPDCRKIQNSEERLKCYDGALSGAEFERDFEDKRERGDFQWPQPCKEANTLTRESCEQTMRKWGESQRQENRFEPQRQMPLQQFQEPTQQPPPPEATTPPPSDGTTTSGTSGTDTTTSGTATTTDTTTSSTTDTSSSGGTGSGGDSGTTTTTPATGAVIFDDGFSNYYFG